jgi:N-acetyl-gamma-glutamyl-phosphate reductase
MIKVGVVGCTGYTGVELIRFLLRHPHVKIEVITSRSQAGTRVADMFPNLRGHLDLTLVKPVFEELAKCDVLFFATPNGTAMQMVPDLLKSKVKIIDLAADFRLKDAQTWEKWYDMKHSCPQFLDEAVYGLPEVNRASIATARLVANPGCYPTAIQLGFLPLLEAGLIDPRHLIADAKSGVSGAGRQASVPTLMAEAGESFKAYKVAGHRHLPEICQGLNSASAMSVGLTFVPHLVPMIRGIHATLYATLYNKDSDLQKLFEDRYQNEHFVDVLPAGSHPETRNVRGSNLCQLAVHRPQNGDTVVILSVIDNLVKGAAGQAVQNMNIMCGFPETMGLKDIALLP